ncbi:unnamed protein product [Adineta steineri]|uniref:Uncharacterized protein n=2 Tax=Adineta steineri TaxID=433720 RepID=A0A815P5L9_9BILA|nr:unnamed protein product [Adineta steineri]CAF1444513.1 unnamed protein product [Adineta steineri]CAF4004254.1 unnamed protein product [Adineta steineri]CAF4038999.1 unnamed protein product [Adineta steineri]
MLNNDRIIIKNQKGNKNKSNLLDFLPLKRYKVFSIDETTSSDTVQELITIAKKTYMMTLFPYDHEKSNIHYLQIELIQDEISIIINIAFFLGYNIVLPDIDELLSIIFHRSKSIQIWGTSERFNYDHGFNLIYSPYNMEKCHFVNIQDLFKIWYNNTFQHNENCGQLLDYNEIDGPLCTCSYRPLKCSTDQWSLKDAITYTFQENLENINISLYECQAITKCATIINEKWHYKKVQDYIKTNHMIQNVMFKSFFFY